MKLRGNNSALDSTLSRVDEIGFVIEHVIDSVHREVVWHEKEQGSDDESEVDASG